MAQKWKLKKYQSKSEVILQSSEKCKKEQKVCEISDKKQARQILADGNDIVKKNWKGKQGAHKKKNEIGTS